MQRRRIVNRTHTHISCAPNTQKMHRVMRAHAYVGVHRMKRTRERRSSQYCPAISCTIVRVRPQSISGTLIRLAGYLSLVLFVSHTHTHVFRVLKLFTFFFVIFAISRCWFISFLFLSTSTAQFTLLLSFPARYSAPSLLLMFFFLLLLLSLWHDSPYRSSSLWCVFSLLLRFLLSCSHGMQTNIPMF